MTSAVLRSEIVCEFVDTLRILGMSWGVKDTCFEAPGVSLGGFGGSIGGVGILRVSDFLGVNSFAEMLRKGCPKP